MRSPCTTTKSSPHLPQLEKALAHSNEDSTQPKINKFKKKKWTSHPYPSVPTLFLQCSLSQEMVSPSCPFLDYEIWESSLIPPSPSESPFTFKQSQNPILPPKCLKTVHFSKCPLIQATIILDYCSSHLTILPFLSPPSTNPFKSNYVNLCLLKFSKVMKSRDSQRNMLGLTAPESYRRAP